MNPLVSIIVPAYNVEYYIEECINSILNLTWDNYEIIIVDDGSTDNTLEILKSYASNNKIHIIETTNGGQSSARNKALSKAKGEFFMYVDSDDCVYPDIIRNLYNCIIETNADIAVCGTDSMINNKASSFVKYKEYIYKSDGCIPAFLLEKFGFGPCGKLYKRGKFIEEKFTEGIIFEDVEYLSRCMLKTECIATISYVGYIYRIHNVSTTHSNFNEKKLDLLKVTDIIFDRFKYNQSNCSEELLCFVASNYITIHLLAIKFNVEKQYIKTLNNLTSWMRLNKSRLFTSKYFPLKKKIYLYMILNNSRLMKFLYVKLS